MGVVGVTAGHMMGGGYYTGDSIKFMRTLESIFRRNVTHSGAVL